MDSWHYHKGVRSSVLHGKIPANNRRVVHVHRLIIDDTGFKENPFTVTDQSVPVVTPSPVEVNPRSTPVMKDTQLDSYKP